jgi:predicted RNase H-like HicB family nuclease
MTSEVTRLIEDAIQFHAEGPKEDGLPMPAPHFPASSSKHTF